MVNSKHQIKRVTLKGQAYDFLKRAILEGELESGRIYSEQYFADMLSVSRTPIREAVLQLSQEGFVEVHPNIGVSVKDISAVEIEEMFQLRSAIEAYCCKIAAEGIKSADGELLLKSLEKHINDEEKVFQATGSPAECMKHDTKFHLAIVQFTHNEQILEIMNRLRSRINLVGIKTLYKQGRTETALAEHRKIISALRRGQGLEAFAEVENHFKMAKDIILSSNVWN